MRGEGSGLCDELITHAEESTGLGVCVCVCLIVYALGNSTLRRPRPALACCATEKKSEITVEYYEMQHDVLLRILQKLYCVFCARNLQELLFNCVCKFQYVYFGKSEMEEQLSNHPTTSLSLQKRTKNGAGQTQEHSMLAVDSDQIWNVNLWLLFVVFSYTTTTIIVIIIIITAFCSTTLTVAC